MGQASPQPESRSLLAKVVVGVVAPQIVLGLLLFLVMASGSGKGEAPTIVFFASLFAMPILALMGTWVLFVSWSTTGRMLAAASVLPLVYLGGSVLSVHGSGYWQGAGMVVMYPFLKVPMRGLEELSLAWVAAMALAIFSAWWRSRKGKSA